ncbi:MAG TPA: class I SAM-dependent methyltransferase [Tepidimicrobium sp.]|nr:class I SAM-dependent methyltransferase [Tepidimicrobium sp.]
MYSNMAVIYDDLMDNVDYKRWHLYIESIFNRFHKKPKSILEMACGTGNLSYYLARNGYNLLCFDISPEMLSIAYNKLQGFDNATLIEQDMVGFNMNKEFDAIISACDGINYILKKEDLLKVFKNVKDHLSEDGIFIFDISSYYKLKHIIGNNTFIEDRGTIYYVWQNYFNNENNIVEFYLTFFMLDKHGGYKRLNEEHLQKAYKAEEITELLQEAGFNRIYYFDEFSFNRPIRETERIHFVALN